MVFLKSVEKAKEYCKKHTRFTKNQFFKDSGLNYSSVKEILEHFEKEKVIKYEEETVHSLKRGIDYKRTVIVSLIYEGGKRKKSKK